MSLQKIYQGEDYSESFSRQVDGVVTPSSDLSEVEVYLFADSTELAKFSMTDRTGDDFIQLDAGPTDGEFILKVPSASTSDWYAGRIVDGEFTFILSNGNRRRFKKELGVIEPMRS